ncbi:HAD family acid phosphatase [Candidatus Neomarinimicrobiota bacterium]
MFTKKLSRFIILLLIINSLSFSQTGKLKVGFDIDDTILYSERAFVVAPKTESGGTDYSWINTHDKEYSLLIDPVITLINFFRAHGHEVFFITARPGINGDSVAVFLSKNINFDVKVDSNLFFSPKEYVNGFKYTTKHRIMEKIDIDIYYGDSDTDIIAAIKADVHPIRIVRSDASIKEYGGNYFGDTHDGESAEAPFKKKDLKYFYEAKVGIFGESIYPITWKPGLCRLKQD